MAPEDVHCLSCATSALARPAVLSAAINSHHKPEYEDEVEHIFSDVERSEVGRILSAFTFMPVPTVYHTSFCIALWGNLTSVSVIGAPDLRPRTKQIKTKSRARV